MLFRSVDSFARDVRNDAKVASITDLPALLRAQPVHLDAAGVAILTATTSRQPRSSAVTATPPSCRSHPTTVSTARKPERSSNGSSSTAKPRSPTYVLVVSFLLLLFVSWSSVRRDLYPGSAADRVAGRPRRSGAVLDPRPHRGCCAHRILAQPANGSPDALTSDLID